MVSQLHSMSIRLPLLRNTSSKPGSRTTNDRPLRRLRASQECDRLLQADVAKAERQLIAAWLKYDLVPLSAVEQFAVDPMFGRIPADTSFINDPVRQRIVQTIVKLRAASRLRYTGPDPGRLRFNLPRVVWACDNPQVTREMRAVFGCSGEIRTAAAAQSWLLKRHDSSVCGLSHLGSSDTPFFLHLQQCRAKAADALAFGDRGAGV
ncbi:hypothetical protein Pan44_53770 [Caulifigura coniformis]|uniref:Uncharacterized protein n=1 Tax=Caulifigura coniformis TaxID=2527983 RepID=A0A517SMF7_9PLAN|nr:hypothetical protein Pan44_53770 [Caulifigura coniformis]